MSAGSRNPVWTLADIAAHSPPVDRASVGFVVAASGYRAESTPYLTGGIVLLAIGIALIVAKVIRRNPSA